jgi:coenzyme F420 hydrogenase subunit beta
LQLNIFNFISKKNKNTLIFKLFSPKKKAFCDSNACIFKNVLLVNMFEDSFNKLEANIKEIPNRGSFYILKSEVIDTAKCMACGMCVSVCKYNALSWNTILKKPEITGKCVACGICYQNCPRSQSSLQSNIGPIEKGFVTKSTKFQGQDGGTVRTLLYSLFQMKKIDAAIVTKASAENNWQPEAFIAKSEKDLNQISTSIYAHPQVISEFINAVKSGIKRIAIVGCPCKAEGIYSMLHGPNGIFKDVSDLKVYNIALFCMEAFNPSKLNDILVTKEIDLKKVAKFDFAGGKFRIYYKEGTSLEEKAAYSISSLHDAVEPSCIQCKDFTGECADISIGSSGAPDGFNTTIARTKELANIIQELIDTKVLDAQLCDNKVFQQVIKSSRNKKAKLDKTIARKEYNPEAFTLHKPSEWNSTIYGYNPELHQEYYQKAEFKESKLNSGEGSPVFVAKVPVTSKADTTKFNYASSYDITKKLLANYPKVNGGKVLIKPNNTGFIGVFKHDILAEILAKNGCTDDCDHQPIATNPAMLTGIVDALIELGAKRIDIGENMLWDGGTQRAFYETGYTAIFSQEKYKNKVFFVDFYENDPPTECLEKIPLKTTKYCKGDYYNNCYPPKALFTEKYDLILIASVAKSHNCAFYTLSNKNFSVSWNPRKKTGTIEPRWQIHGLPLDVFKKERIKEILGEDFKRKNKIFVRQVYNHRWDFIDKKRVVTPAKSGIILSNQYVSTGIMRHFKSFGNEVLDVDPHHWSGINIGVLTMGIGYLINRYTRIFGAVVNKLKEQGTEVACVCSGIIGQEGDGPLVYGSMKYAGFNTASFDHVALERVLTELMYGADETGFIGMLKRRQQKRMDEHKITCPELIDECENLWTLKIMHDLIGGNFDLNKIPITLLNYTGELQFEKVTPTALFKLREGSAFRSSLGYYCNPDLWLKLLHNNDSLYMAMMLLERGDIEIPLIPGVVG